MAGHGIPRVSQVEPRGLEEAEREQQEIEQYKAVVQKLEDRMRDQDYGLGTLRLITQILKKNPEYYTVWNHRRRVLGAILLGKDEASDKESELVNDLRFLVSLMLKFPKCYWIWNYRLWLLEQSSRLLPDPNARAIWKEELSLVSKMLSRDERNFHGWRYRRIVVAALESNALKVDGEASSLVKPEFDYTTKMINLNLSNFSAWHNRSKLIPRLLDEQGAGDEERRAMLDEELNLIHEALIDPYDQSLWFYHACLTSAFSTSQAAKSIAPGLTNEQRAQYLTGEIAYVMEMLDGTDDCKWIYQTLIQLAIDYESLTRSWPESGSREDIGRWMGELRRLDPLRNGRWAEMEQRMLD